MDYDYADRESVIELLELIQPLDKEIEEYLEGVTDSQLHGLLKNDLESYSKIRKLAETIAYQILNKEDAMGKFKEFSVTVQGMHFAENFEAYKAKTDYEFVRHESYGKMTEIAERIERIKTKTEYFRATLKVREVLSKYGEKESHFSKTKWRLMEGDELIPLYEKQKAMDNELQKAKNNVAYLNSALYKEEQEKAQKDLQNKKDIYNKIKTLNDKKNEIQQDITDFSDRKKAVQDGYESATVVLNQFVQDRENLAKEFEDFRLKWDLGLDIETDVQMKLDEIQAIEKEIETITVQGGDENETQALV